MKSPFKRTEERKKHSSRKKYFNFVIIPHATAKVSTLKIPVWLLKTVAVMAVGAVCVSAYLVHTYSDLIRQSHELKVVKAVNQTQKTKITELEKRTASVESRIKELDQLDVEVRKMVGLKTDETESETASRGDTGSRGGAPRPASPEGLDVTVLGDFVEPGVESDGGLQESLERLNALDVQLEDLDSEVGQEEEMMGNLQSDVEERLNFLEHYPSRWPVFGRITSYFGNRKNPFGSGYEFHNGLDIANSYGTTIRAAGKGVVESAGWQSGYGWTVVINHGYGYETFYGHCSRMYVKPGETVQAGEAIAAIGTTGRTTGPHVHFTVFYRGKEINPLKVLD